MPKLSNEIVKFANGNTDFYVAFGDYYNHVNSNEGRKFGAFDTSVSLDEKSDKVHKAFFAEVERVSGVKRTADNAEAWAANPQVQWATFAILNATINSTLPASINPSIGLWTDMRYVSYGDMIHFKIRPRTLYTVSKGNFRPVH